MVGYTLPSHVSFIKTTLETHFLPDFQPSFPQEEYTNEKNLELQIFPILFFGIAAVSLHHVISTF